MPVIFDPDPHTQERLVSLLPPGTQAVSDMDALLTLSTELKGNMWKGPFHMPRMKWYCWKLLEA